MHNDNSDPSPTPRSEPASLIDDVLKDVVFHDEALPVDESKALMRGVPRDKDYAAIDHGHIERARLRERLRHAYNTLGHDHVRALLEGKVVVNLHGRCVKCGTVTPWPKKDKEVRALMAAIVHDLRAARSERIRTIEILLKYGVGQPVPFASNTITPVSPEVRARVTEMVERIQTRESWPTEDLLTMLERVWSTPGGET